MLRNNIIIALRNLWKNKLITAINLIGMTLGFSVFLTLFSWIQFDLGFDKFHKDFERIYILNNRLVMNGSEYTSERSAGIYATLLPDNFPQIKESCRISQPQEFELGIKGDSSKNEQNMLYFNEDNVLAVDSTFLKFFTFPLVEGEISKIFSERDHIVITESLSEKIFGKESPIGKDLKIGEGGFFKVVGLVQDPPNQSTIQFKALVGFHIMEEMGYPINDYGGTMYTSFFKLQEEIDLQELNQGINKLVEENHDSDLEAVLFLDSFKRLYLHGENKRIIGFYLNLFMSLIILAIACINFINLTMAYSMTRMKETVIRKNLGASRKQLILQFMGETYIILAVALYFGLFALEQIVPIIGQYFGDTPDPNFSSFSNILILLTIFIVTGIIAGLYPAYKIAGFNSLEFLSGKKMGLNKRGSRSRKILIVIQFTFSIIFILLTIFLSRQYSFLREADLGFNREDVLYISTSGKSWEKYETIKGELKELHFVENVTSGSAIPTTIMQGDIDWGERDGEHNKLARIIWTSPDFTETFDIDIVAGEYFSAEKGSLNNEYVVINKSLIELMGWEGDPIGRTFYQWGEDYRILGVTEDINFFPFNIEAFGNEALIYRYDDVREFIFVRVTPGINSREVAMIENIFSEHNPGYEFIADFVKDYKIEAQQSEGAVKMMFKLFSAIAIFIAIMGLIGLSVYNNTRRTKEVGIRMVMGASSKSILRLLITEFVKLLLISNLIALPIAYLLLRKGLNFFSYSVDLNPLIFLLVLIGSVILTVLTVSYHAIGIARSNPVNSLRND